jgi:N utilization substance protein B
MGNRRLARECALQTIYLADTGKMAGAELAAYKDEAGLNAGKENLEFFKDLVLGVETHRADIDNILASYAQNWTVSRMSAVDRSILRLAAYELIFSGEATPPAAVIDEAIELAKRFSTENSSRFINGLLDQVKKERKNG